MCDSGGSVYVYRGTGSSWFEAEHLYPPNCSYDGHFGGSLSFSGGTLLIGEPGVGYFFGDGLRCAGGGLVRLQVRFCDAGGVSYTTIPLGAKGGVSPGDSRHYQCWYRNQSTPACGLGVNEFNTSNGFEVSWVP